MKRTFTIALVAFCVVGGMAVRSALADDKASPTSGSEVTATSLEPAESPAPDEKPQVAAEKSGETGADEQKLQVRRRVPRYYGQLDLDESQRSEIYSIQAKYQDQLDDLTRRITMLKAERDEALRAVLKTAQKRKLTSLQNRLARAKLAGPSISDSPATDAASVDKAPE